MSSFLKPFEFVLNTALAQDPETKEKLEQFDGRRIAINVSDIELTILAVFDQQKIQLSTSDSNESDLSIRVHPSIFLKSVVNLTRYFLPQLKFTAMCNLLSN